MFYFFVLFLAGFASPSFYDSRAKPLQTSVWQSRSIYFGTPATKDSVQAALIVAHCYEDYGWLHFLEEEGFTGTLFLYEKCDLRGTQKPPWTEPSSLLFPANLKVKYFRRWLQNAGDECLAYIQFMLDHYEDPPEFMIFIHGAPYWHMSVNNFMWRLKFLDTSHEFVWLNDMHAFGNGCHEYERVSSLCTMIIGDNCPRGAVRFYGGSHFFIRRHVLQRVHRDRLALLFWHFQGCGQLLQQYDYVEGLIDYHRRPQNDCMYMESWWPALFNTSFPPVPYLPIPDCLLNEEIYNSRNFSLRCPYQSTPNAFFAERVD